MFNTSPGNLRTAFEPVPRRITDYLLDWKSTHEWNLPLPSAASVSSLSWGSSRPTSKRLLLSPPCTIRAVVTMFGAELRGTPWIVTFKILDRRNVAKLFQTSDPNVLCKILRTRKTLIVTFSYNTGWNIFMHSNKECIERFKFQIYWIRNIALSSNKINILTRYYFLYIVHGKSCMWLPETYVAINFVNIFNSMVSTKNQATLWLF